MNVKGLYDFVHYEYKSIKFKIQYIISLTAIFDIMQSLWLIHK